MKRITLLFFNQDIRKSNVKVLDGLRGFAILLVLFSHGSIEFDKIIPFINWKGMGKGGVFLFFVLSAYLLDKQIIRAINLRQTNKSFWINYLLRRFLRVYPLFILALLLNLFLHTIGYYSNIKSLKDIFNHLLLIDGQGVFWSIAVEFKYYFISALLLWITYSRLKLPSSVFITTCIMYAICSFLLALNFNLDGLSIIPYLYVFFIGTIIASLHENNLKPTIILFSKNYIPFISASLILLSYVILPKTFISIFGDVLTNHKLISRLIWALTSGFLILSLQINNSLLKSFFELTWIRLLGKISFSLYLFHIPILGFARDLYFLPSYLTGIIFLILSICFSIVTYLLIENPISRIRIKGGKIHFAPLF